MEREELREAPFDVNVPLDGTDASAKVALEQRQKGLLWFPTYTLDFHAPDTFTNPDARARSVEVRLPLDQENAVYDGFEVLDEKGRSVPAEFGTGAAVWTVPFQASEARHFTVGYRTRGTGSWRYPIDQGTGQVRNFKLTLDTDFPEVDFPWGRSPDDEATAGGQWHGEWRFTSLVANGVVGLGLPQRLNPGDLASKFTLLCAGRAAVLLLRGGGVRGPDAAILTRCTTSSSPAPSSPSTSSSPIWSTTSRCSSRLPSPAPSR